MMKATLLAILAVGSFVPALAGNGAIGIAEAPGRFKVNGSDVSGNATLFNGATVETARASSRLRVQGARLELNPGSRLKVFEKSAALELGAGELAGSEYAIEARSLRIAPEGQSTVARVKLDEGKGVLVAAANGPVRVYNHLGDLVASVRAGSALSLIPEPAQAENSNLTGCVKKVDGKYLLTDTTANITVELRGTDLDANVGKRVDMTGSTFRTATPAPGASKVVRVVQIKNIGTDCEEPAAPTPSQPASPTTSVPQTPKPPAGGGGGMSSGAKIALVVAGAGGAAGAAIAAASGGSKSR
ncbi:MAG: hypothetical protein U0Q16_16905 [Bryobacteraceae bacterium]